MIDLYVFFLEGKESMGKRGISEINCGWVLVDLVEFELVEIADGRYERWGNLERQIRLHTVSIKDIIKMQSWTVILKVSGSKQRIKCF